MAARVGHGSEWAASRVIVSRRGFRANRTLEPVAGKHLKCYGPGVSATGFEIDGLFAEVRE